MTKPARAKKNKSSNRGFDDFVEFLSPLIDLTSCDCTTLTGLRHDHRTILSKLEKTGGPLLLVVEGTGYLLCDAKTYFDLETKRQCVLSQYKTVKDVLQIGKVQVLDPRVTELKRLRQEIHSLKKAVKTHIWEAANAKDALSNSEQRAAKLAAELKKSASGN